MIEQLVSSDYLLYEEGLFVNEDSRGLSISAKDISELSRIAFFLNGLLWKLEGTSGNISSAKLHANFAGGVGGNFRPEAAGSPRLRQQPSLRRKVAEESRETSPIAILNPTTKKRDAFARHFGRALDTVPKVGSRTRETRRKVQRAVRSSSREKPDISHNYWRCLPEAV